MPSSKPAESPTTPPNPQEAQKIADLHRKILALEKQIASTRAAHAEVAGKLKNPSPASTVSRHISLLHRYNEIKDVGQGLMGMIAERRGVRVGDVSVEFGVGGE